jgi:hypothetical protein
MRLWSLHPRHLDPAGLVAAWREALLARAVLRGCTRGYRAHPQLARFQAHPAPVQAINAFLAAIYEESQARGYRFDRRRFGPYRACGRIAVTVGQLEYEWRHLRRKLKGRNAEWYRKCRGMSGPDLHPLFRVRPGPVEPWERQRTT